MLLIMIICMAESKQQKFIKGSAILIASNLIIKGINFFLLPLYTNYLTPEMLGISDSISNLTAVLFPLLVLGMDSAFGAFYFDKRSEDHYRSVFTTVRITLIISSLVPMFIALASRQISTILFGDAEYYLLVAISLISVSMNLWHLPFSLLARMRNRMGIFALVHTTASLTMIVSNIVLLTVFKLGVYSLILSTAFIQLVQLTMYMLLLKERFNFKAFDKDLLKRMLPFALPLIPNALAVWVLALSDRYIVLYFCGAEEVGLYGIAARFATAVALVANGIYMSYTTYAYDKKGDADDRKHYARILNAFVYAIMGICATVSMFASEIIDIMTEASYANADVLIAPILFGQLFYGVNTLIGYAITFEKKSKFILIVTSTGAAANVILNIIFVPHYGALAASYTTMISYLIMVILTYVFAQKLFYVQYDTVKLIISILIALALSCCAVWMPLPMRVALYIAMVAGYTWFFRSSAKDYVNQARRFVKR